MELTFGTAITLCIAVLIIMALLQNTLIPKVDGIVLSAVQALASCALFATLVSMQPDPGAGSWGLENLAQFVFAIGLFLVWLINMAIGRSITKNRKGSSE